MSRIRTQYSPPPRGKERGSGRHKNHKSSFLLNNNKIIFFVFCFRPERNACDECGGARCQANKHKTDYFLYCTLSKPVVGFADFFCTVLSSESGFLAAKSCVFLPKTVVFSLLKSFNFPPKSCVLPAKHGCVLSAKSRFVPIKSCVLLAKNSYFPRQNLYSSR
jgi:hypothetical protein